MKISASRILLFFVFTAAFTAAHGAGVFRNLETGEPESIEDHKVDGKWLVVMLWASDCIACNNEAHQYVDFHHRHKDDDAIVLGVSLDGEGKVAEAEAFVSRHQVNFANLLAEGVEIVDYYQNLTNTPWIGTPSFLIFGPDGSLEAKQVGAVPAALIDQFLAQYTGG